MSNPDIEKPEAFDDEPADLNDIPQLRREPLVEASMRETLVPAYAPYLRIAEQWQQQNDSAIGSMVGGLHVLSAALPQVRIGRLTDALETFASVMAPFLSVAEEWRQQNASMIKAFADSQQFAVAAMDLSGIKTTFAQFAELSKPLEASVLRDVTLPVSRLHASLEAGARIDLLLGQGAGWKTQQGVDLARIARAQVELAGWAARVSPDRGLLVATAAPLDLWRGLVLDLPERPELVVPLRAGRATAALTGAELLVRTEAGDYGPTEEAAELVESSVLAPWESGRLTIATELYIALSGFDARVPELLQGAWDDLVRQGPAAAEKAAHLVVEVLDRTLRSAAPDDQVLAWHSQNGRPKKELDTKGGPTHALRVRYLARSLQERGVIGAEADALAKLLGEVRGEAQGVKHASNGGIVTARTLLMAAETLLAQLFLRD